MADNKLRKICVFYIQLILFPSIKPHLTIGMNFKLIKGTDRVSSAGDREPLIRKEFFRCAREQSCTHVVQLANAFVVIHGSEELRKMENRAVRIYEKVNTEGNRLSYV